MLPGFNLADDISVFTPTHIAGAAADTAVSTNPGVIYGVIIGTAGAASSLVKLYDGAVSGTPIAEIMGDVDNPVFIGPLYAFCASSIHVATVDSVGTQIGRAHV